MVVNGIYKTSFSLLDSHSPAVQKFPFFCWCIGSVHICIVVFCMNVCVKAFLGVAQFFVVVLASLVIGVLVGMAASFMTRFSAHVHGG